MLTEFELHGLRRMLHNMNLHDLSSLTGTVTNGLITVASKEDAIEAICKYIQHPFDLLKRKKITKKILFDYLHSENVPVTINGDKYVFITAILNYWKSASHCVNITEVEADMVESGTMATPVQLSGVTNNVQVSNNSGINAKEMALKFGGWFYSLLNGIHEINSEFGPKHFWPDCKLEIEVNYIEEPFAIGNEHVSSTLVKLMTTHKLYLNPNLSDEVVQAEMESHGLIAIMIRGTVIQSNVCIGVFDQSFGLIQDPSAGNSWKVKFTKLKLQSADKQKEILNEEKFTIKQ
ncbi:hypothetical protein GQR58_003747 [Nymphon striatum]|nr:hypothetical protein GQR58_025817 [Nymphon striatum]KAG1705772.1 hypothetical protein GQR58_003747 [Nymphon striatum]